MKSIADEHNGTAFRVQGGELTPVCEWESYRQAVAIILYPNVHVKGEKSAKNSLDSELISR